MNEERFNLTLRKFLKTFGIAGQREIERAVDEADRNGELQGVKTLHARATLVVEGLPLEKVIEGEIELE